MAEVCHVVDGLRRRGRGRRDRDQLRHVDLVRDADREHAHAASLRVRRVRLEKASVARRAAVRDDDRDVVGRGPLAVLRLEDHVVHVPARDRSGMRRECAAAKVGPGV